MGMILASKSARREELLKKITDKFTIVPSDVDETTIEERDPLRFAVEAALKKAKDIGDRYPDDVVIGADTVVSLEGAIIGKPKDAEDARRILGLLSGTKHRVITGVAVYRGTDKKLFTGYEISYVKFKKLSVANIEEVISEDDYMDKAGAYAIQSIGDRFVEEVKGDYDNVVGLPVRRLREVLNMFYAPEYEVEIEDIALPKNWGVGRSEGMVVFVPEAVYGDRVKVVLTEKKKRFAYGKISEVIKPSPYRTEPECGFFGACGGCALQSLEYQQQLILKERYLTNTIQKIAGKDALGGVMYEPIVPSPDIFYYRNKMEFAFGKEDGKTVIGLRERFSPDKSRKKNTVALTGCKIFSKIAEDILPVFAEFADKTGRDVYNPYTNEGFFRHLVIREGKNTGEVMILLITRSGEPPDLTKLADVLPDNVKSFWWVENDRISDVVSFERKHHLFGNTFITEQMEGLKFRISPQSFFQPNTKAAELLYNSIKKEITKAGVEHLLGLYCGSGVMEIFLASAAQDVAGVDIEPFNIFSAEENCKANKIQNCRFYQCPAEDIKRHRGIVQNPDAIIVDPPRAGLSRKALTKITSIGSKRIIYVSCNVSAFVRDTVELQTMGYRLEKLRPFDFFPHTTHLETLGVFVQE